MKTINRSPLFIAALLLGMSCNVPADDSQKAISQLTSLLEDDTHVDRWNKFVEDLFSLHQHIIKNQNIYTRESKGGYGGVTNDPEFYREVRHYDKKTDKLLSNIKWENKNPEDIHSIDIYIYDDKGRIIRDYSAYYLPKHRNAPYQTFINIHHYSENLHSFRQFDANNEILFEFCEGSYNGKPVKISHEYHEIPDKISDISDMPNRDSYQACFNQLAKSAGAYLHPLNEIQSF